MVDERVFSIEELAAELSITPRAIRYYQTEGYLHPPEIRARRAVYNLAHLRRLQDVLALKSEKSLAEIGLAPVLQSEAKGEDTPATELEGPRVEQIVRLVVRKGIEVIISPHDAGLGQEELQMLFARIAVAVNDPGQEGMSLNLDSASPAGTVELLNELSELGLTDQAFRIIHPNGNDTIHRHREYAKSVRSFRTDSDNAAVNHRLQYCLHFARRTKKRGESLDWESIARRAIGIVPL